MKRRHRIVLGVLVAAGLFLSTLAMPVRVWRTGELPVPPLDMQSGVAFARPTDRLWVDTDIACGTGPRTDPDDCLALLLLSRTLWSHVVGMSTIAGNAPRATVEAVAREFLDAAGRNAPPAALADALKEGPLTVLALGPLTNIAAALDARPELQPQVTSVIAVMGRRQGHVFHPSEGRGRGGMLLGHGPVFTDFNFEQDRDAAARLIRMGVPLTLIPYEAARGVSVTTADLNGIAASGPAGAWVARGARDWLRFWHEEVGLNGFYPFDLLAPAYLLTPERFACARVAIWISPARWPFRESMFVGLPREQPEAVRVSGTAVYCPAVAADLHAWLMQQLAR